MAAKPPEGEALSGSGQEGGKQLQGRQPALSAVTPQPGTAPSPQEVLDKRFLEQVRVCTPASTSPPPQSRGAYSCPLSRVGTVSISSRKQPLKTQLPALPGA